MKYNRYKRSDYVLMEGSQISAICKSLQDEQLPVMDIIIHKIESFDQAINFFKQMDQSIITLKIKNIKIIRKDEQIVYVDFEGSIEETLVNDESSFDEDEDEDD